jgi:signal transduction histidine kinase
MGKYLFFLLIGVFTTSLFATTSVTVGIYNNPPKIFLNLDNQPSGFFVDLLNRIAQENHWSVSYVPCQWNECLQKLENGEIDMMPDVAYSKSRETRFDFNDEAVLSSWSVVYAKPSAQITSILDLNDKHVAVLKNSIQAETIKHDSALFDIKPVFLEVNSFRRAFELLKQNKVDAAIVNNFYTDPLVSHFQKTNILLNPAVLKFAFTKNEHPELIARIDDMLKALKADQTSIYYQAKNRWFDVHQKNTMPFWAQWALGGFFVLCLLLIGLNFFFKHRLNLKIRALKEAEKLLLVQSRNAAMGEMISMIAHQWKQPLSVLSTIAGQIKMDSELGVIKPEKFNTYYDQLTRQIFYLAHTIDDFRDYFKPNKAKEIVEDPNSIVESALALIGKTLENHGIKVIKEYDTLAQMNLYTNDLIQVLLNLFKNADEAFLGNAIGEKRLTIRTYQNDENNVVIDVEDNAGGISDEIKDRIFEPYFTTKSNSSGTGLGLYISKTIIESHFNGTLSVTSKNGTTRFSIVLPPS